MDNLTTYETQQKNQDEKFAKINDQLKTYIKSNEDLQVTLKQSKESREKMDQQINKYKGIMDDIKIEYERKIKLSEEENTKRINNLEDLNKKLEINKLDLYNE